MTVTTIVSLFHDKYLFTTFMGMVCHGLLLINSGFILIISDS